MWQKSVSLTEAPKAPDSRVRRPEFKSLTFHGKVRTGQAYLISFLSFLRPRILTSVKGVTIPVAPGLGEG